MLRRGWGGGGLFGGIDHVRGCLLFMVEGLSGNVVVKEMHKWW